MFLKSADIYSHILSVITKPLFLRIVENSVISHNRKQAIFDLDDNHSIMEIFQS